MQNTDSLLSHKYDYSLIDTVYGLCTKLPILYVLQYAYSNALTEIFFRAINDSSDDLPASLWSAVFACPVPDLWLKVIS